MIAKKHVLPAAFMVFAALYTGARAQTAFNVGDHVLIGLNGRTGTIIAVGTALMDGGTFIKVHFDDTPPGFPDVGVSYDTVVARVTVTAPAAPAAAPAMPMPAAAPAAAPAMPMPAAAPPTVAAPTIVAAAPAAPVDQPGQGSSAVRTGLYQCFGESSPLGGLNFTVTGNGAYTDVDGNRGTYTMGGGFLTFRGGDHNGEQATFFPGPDARNPPHITFQNTVGGGLGYSCDLQL